MADPQHHGTQEQPPSEAPSSILASLPLRGLWVRGLWVIVLLLIVVGVWSIFVPPKSLFIVSGQTTRLQTTVAENQNWAMEINFQNVSLLYQNDYPVECFSGWFRPKEGTTIEFLAKRNGMMDVVLTPLGFDPDVPSTPGGPVGNFSPSIFTPAADVEALTAVLQTTGALREGTTLIQHNPSCDLSEASRPQGAAPLDFVSTSEPILLNGPTQIGRAVIDAGSDARLGRDHVSVSGQIEVYAPSLFCALRDGCPIHRVLPESMTIPPGATIMPGQPSNIVQRVDALLFSNEQSRLPVVLGEVVLAGDAFDFAVSINAAELNVVPPSLGADVQRSYKLNSSRLQQLAAEPTIPIIISFVIFFMSLKVSIAEEARNGMLSLSGLLRAAKAVFKPRWVIVKRFLRSLSPSAPERKGKHR